MTKLFLSTGVACLLALILLGSASASVSISFTAGMIRGADGLPVDLNTVGVLVADTAHDGFGTAETLPGSTLLVNSSLGGADNIILQVFQAEDLGGGLIGFNGNVNYTDVTLVSPGTPLAFFWFPTIKSAGETISKSVSVGYGVYRTDSIDIASGAGIAFSAPPDGSNSALAVFDNLTVDGALATVANLTTSKVTTAPDAAPPVGSQDKVAPQLVISGSSVFLTVKSSVRTRSYQLQYSDDLTSASWTDVGPVQTGDGSDLTISTLYDSKVTKRFFRLKVW